MSAHRFASSFVALAAIALGASLPVQAGTNGQQVSFRAFGDISRVKITVEYQLKDKRGTYACLFYVNLSQSGNWVELLAPTNDVPASQFRRKQDPMPECLTSRR